MRKTSIALCLLLFLLLGLAGALAWTAYTAGGTRFLVTAVTRALPGTVEVREVSGRIGHALRLGGLKVNLSEQEVSVDEVILEWQPLNLFAGTLSVSSLKLSGLSVIDRSPDEETDFDPALPKAPRWLNLIHGWVEEFSIDGLTYKKEGGEAVAIDSVSAGITWYWGILRVKGLKAEAAAYGTLNGSVAMNLSRPALWASLQATLTDPLAGIDGISLDAALLSSRGGKRTAGPVDIRTYSEGREGFRIESRVLAEGKAITLGPVRVTEKGRKGLVEAEGTLDLAGERPAFKAAVTVSGLDLEPEVGEATDLSGKLDISGDTERFLGSLTAKSAGDGWKDLSLKAAIEGTGERLELKELSAQLLGGTLRGEAAVSWAAGTAFSASLSGRGLDPGKVQANLAGSLNFEMKGSLASPVDRPAEAALLLTLHDSLFQGKGLSGKLDATLRGETVNVRELRLVGSGFNVRAQGIVQERLSYEIRIDDASQFLPGAAGAMNASGWARWRSGEVAGVLRASGRKISYAGADVSSLNVVFEMPGGYEGALSADIAARGISYGPVEVGLVTLKAAGRVKDHRIDLAATEGTDRIDAAAQGGYVDASWRGTIQRVSVDEARLGTWRLEKPSAVVVSKDRILLSSFSLAGRDGENIYASADMNLGPMAGSIAVKWQQVNLARTQKLLPESLRLTGRTSGDLGANWRVGDLSSVSGSLNAAGSLSTGALKLEAVKVTGMLDWGARGLSASLETDLSGSGTISARASSNEPARAGLPGRGTFSTQWREIDLALLRAVIPRAVRSAGKLSGEAGGGFLPGDRFDLSGRTSVAGGSFSWRADDGTVSMLVNEASLEWTWRGDSLAGKMDLGLTDGHMKSSFRLPVAARLPLGADPNGAVRVSVDGEFREKGLLAVLLPGIVQETRGQVRVRLLAEGAWKDPVVNGNVRLSGAGVYLPSTGTTVSDIGAEAVFDRNRVEVRSFTAISGGGRIGGSMTADLSGRSVTGYRGLLKGDRFRAIHLPELQVSISPDLTFEGTLERVSVNGSIVVPEMLVRPQQIDSVVKTSPDVVILNGMEGAGKKTPFAIDALIAVHLGDSVIVRAYGLDTRLGGNVAVTVRETDDIRVNGTISTVGGTFNAYGVRLDVTRGRILFTGGPAELAGLDILAVRRVSDVTAGVMVTGTVSSPSINLYSVPAMSDADTLSYIVLGRPTSTAGSGDAALLMSAAGSLLTSGDSPSLQGRLADQLGLDTFDIEPGEDGLSQSIVTVGKYLSPRLYISYGRSIFTDENIITARYSLSRRFDVETKMGTESSIGLLYRIEFD